MQAFTSKKTIFSLQAELAQRHGIEFPIETNTTVNEKLNILPGVRPETAGYPILTGLIFGRGGGSVMFNDYRQASHEVFHGTLYDTIPLIMRPVTNDLNNEERKRYRLRKEVNINGIDYAEYYMMKIPDVEEISTKRIIMTNGDPVISTYEYNYDEILNPTAIMEPQDPTVTDKTYLMISSKIELIFSTQDLQEIKDALVLKYGENTSLNITELGICQGYLKEDISTYEESISTQIAYFIPFDYELQTLINSKEDFVKKIELGGIEPII